MSREFIIKPRRPLEADLPAHAPDGEILITSDTKKIYRGKGDSLPLEQIATGGGGAVSSVAGRTGDVVLAESDITNLTADLAAKASNASVAVVAAAVVTEAAARVAADSSEASARTSGDAATLAAAEAYTDAHRLDLEVNGTPNLDQDKLNLIPGPDATISDVGPVAAFLEAPSWATPVFATFTATNTGTGPNGVTGICSYLGGLAQDSQCVITGSNYLAWTWQANHAYVFGDVVFDGTNLQTVTNEGTSGSSAPTWGTNLGDSTSDGPDLAWSCITPVPTAEQVLILPTGGDSVARDIDDFAVLFNAVAPSTPLAGIIVMTTGPDADYPFDRAFGDRTGSEIIYSPLSGGLDDGAVKIDAIIPGRVANIFIPSGETDYDLSPEEAACTVFVVNPNAQTFTMHFPTTPRGLFVIEAPGGSSISVQAGTNGSPVAWSDSSRTFYIDPAGIARAALKTIPDFNSDASSLCGQPLDSATVGVPNDGDRIIYDNNTTEYEAYPQYVATPPATASDPGKPGQMAFDATYVYLCIADATWVRAPLIFATF